jgi:hypothetical protein
LQIAPPFIIKSLLFSTNDAPGYTNPVIIVRSNNSIDLLHSSFSSNSTSNSTPCIFSTWNINIPSDYFKKKKIIELKVRLITNDEERKKEEENLKHLKELYKKDEQTINDLKITNRERKKE